MSALIECRLEPSGQSFSLALSEKEPYIRALVITIDTFHLFLFSVLFLTDASTSRAMALEIRKRGQKEYHPESGRDEVRGREGAIGKLRLKIHSQREIF